MRARSKAAVPSRKTTIPLLRPSIGRTEERLVLQVLRSGQLTQGPMVEALERELAAHTGAREVVAVSSGTAALHLALLVSGVGPGDEVVLPSFTFVATANVVRLLGATPVFVDIDPRTYNLNPALLPAALTARTRAILPVHQIGLPYDRDAVRRCARGAGIQVVEDAACAIGASWRGKPIGADGLVCFSFHPRKVVTSGEGGAILLGDRRVADRLRRLRSHGLASRASTGPVPPLECMEPGFNFRLSDVNAALALGQVRRLEALVGERRRLASRYARGLEGLPGLLLPWTPRGAEPTYQTYLVRVTDDARLGRDELLSRLSAEGIGARIGVAAIHLQPAYRSTRASLPETERAARETLALPLYPGLSLWNQDRVIQSLKRLLA